MNHSLDLPTRSKSRSSGSVECLGQSFPTDEARREHFIGRLRAGIEELHAKLDVPFTTVEDAIARMGSVEGWPMGDAEQNRTLAGRMRSADRGKGLLQRWKDEVGFPHGEIEDILRLSDPPYYTACPNPFLGEFIEAYGRLYGPSEPYHREPFAADVSEGKNDPIYNAHSYHTKVPHKAIMRYILHYTEPGDIVFDGFCGTGMTGVAAQMCGDRKTVESLGYRVEADGTILQQEPGENGKPVWKPFSKLGARRAVLNDLSPAATFIAYNYNTPVDVAEFEREAKRILREVEAEYGWMYATLHKPTAEQLERAVRALENGVDPKQVTRDQSLPWGKINYTVWSDVFTCPECAGEVVFWDVAVDQQAAKVSDEFPCPHCQVMLSKRELERSWVTRLDTAINQTIRQGKQLPVQNTYSVGRTRFEKKPDAFDLALTDWLSTQYPDEWFPVDRMMKGGETRRNDPAGMTHVHHFFTQRDLAVLGAVWQKARMSPASRLIMLSVTSVHPEMPPFRCGCGYKGVRRSTRSAR